MVLSFFFFLEGVGWGFVFCLFGCFGDYKCGMSSDLHIFVPFHGYTFV